MENHIMDYRNMVCSCGRTKEQHIKINLVSDKIKERWLNGDVCIKRDFAEIDIATSLLMSV